MQSLRYLNPFLLRYKWHLVWGLVFVLLSNLFQILPAQLVRFSIDLVIDNIQTYRLLGPTRHQQEYFSLFGIAILFYAGLILIMALLRGWFLYFVRQTLIVMSRHIEFDLKNVIFDHYQRLSMAFYRRNNTGDLMNRISEDVSRVRMYLGPSIMYGLQLITLFRMLIPVMISISPKLTLYALLPLPLLSFSIYYVNTIIENRSARIQESQSRLSTFVQEAFSGIRVLKSFAREEESAGRFLSESDEYRHQSIGLTRVQALFYPTMLGLIGISTILTVFAGSTEVMAGRLSFGHIAEFVIYINLLTWPVTLLGWTSSMVQRAEASQKRINAFLSEVPEILPGPVQRPILGEVEFRNVSFTYPHTGIQALRDVSFRIAPGRSLAVIGTTGSGKSTIAALLMRMYDAGSGEILVDGIPVRDYDLGSLRGQTGYVPQDVFLFSDTIRNNIAFGPTAVDEADVVRAAKDADVYDNIMAFPQKFETRIGERGITLSGGQKQRVSIARAIVRKPSLLILDDALSAVDTRTEDTILNRLKQIMMDRTTILISHRPSTAKLADHVIVLRDGCILEEGTHDELMRSKGYYFGLMERQEKED